MTVRAEGKKYLTVKDKTRNDHQSRTSQEVIVRAGQGNKWPCRARQDKKCQSEQDRAGNNRQSSKRQENTV
jgi:hypothetical protein